MSNAERLYWNRKNVLKMTQEEFANKAGLCAATIARLEKDESHWEVIQASTFDKITAMFEDGNFWPLKFNGVETPMKEVEKVLEKKEETEQTPVWAIQLERGLNDMMTDEDKKTMVLLEFAFERLKKSETHSDFEEKLKLIKEILYN